MKKLFLLILCFNAIVVFGQQSKTLQDINKAINLIDEANWKGETYESYQKEVDALEKHCKTFDCGEVPIHLMMFRAANDINIAKTTILYNELLPTLNNRKIESPIIKSFGHELAGLHYILNAQHDSAFYHLNIAKETLEKNTPTDKRMGRVNEYLGFYYSFQNIHDTSLTYMTEAIDVHLINEDTLSVIKAKKYLSTFYNVMGKTENSITTLLETKKLVDNFPEAKDYSVRINAGLANAYLSLEDYEKAVQTSKKAIKEIKQQKNAINNAVDLWDFNLIIAEAKLKINQSQEAITYIEKAKAICEKYNLSNLQVISTLAFEAEAYMVNEQFDDTEKTLVKMYDIIKSEKLESYKIKIANLLFKLSVEGHSFNSNLMRQFKSQIRALTNENKDYNVDALTVFKLQTVYDILDNRKMAALENFNHVLVITDSIKSQKHNKELNELLIRQENLEQTQELATQEIELKNKTIQRNALIAGFLLILITVGGLIFRAREKQRLNQLLEQKIEARTEELRLANTQLSQSNKELERFNYIISHDLKEPLRNILGFISLMNHRQMIENEELQKFFNHISYNGKQMNLLLENVTEYQNITNKSIELSEVDITAVISHILQEEAIVINAKNAVVEFNTIPTITTDKEAIYLVFKNLIDNGLKFNEATQPMIHINYSEEKNHHKFIVRDNGIGISSDYHDQVFVLFKRLHHRGKYEGSGVGLSMCKQIVENLNGSISIQKETKNGTAFEILLPKI